MNLVRSKQRGTDHGEVFTPAWMVDAMLDLVKGESEHVLRVNIVNGDALTMTTAEGQPITFTEWGYLGKGKFQRRDFRYDTLTQMSSFGEGTLFADTFVAPVALSAQQGLAASKSRWVLCSSARPTRARYVANFTKRVCMKGAYNYETRSEGRPHQAAGPRLGRPIGEQSNLSLQSRKRSDG